jgi:hypothetical protein
MIPTLVLIHARNVRSLACVIKDNFFHAVIIPNKITNDIMGEAEYFN